MTNEPSIEMAKFKYPYKSLRTSISLVILTLITSTMMMGQSITTTELLERVIKIENEQLPYSSNINFYNTTNQGMPIVDEIGFRTETNEFDFEQQQYQLRFKFNSQSERNAISKITRVNQKEYEIKQELYKLNKLNELYNNMVIWYIAKIENPLIEQELLLLNDKKNVLHKLMKNGDDFELNKWMSNETNIRKIRLEIIQNKSIIKEIRDEFNISYGIEGTLHIEDWISISNLKKWLKDNLTTLSIHPNDALNKASEEAALAEFDLEQAKGNKWLDFVQFQYKGKDKLDIEREFSVGTSIIIPFKSTNRIKQNEAQTSILKTKEKTKLQQQVVHKNKRKIIAKINRLITEHEQTISFISDQKTQETFEAYQNIRTMSPLVLIDINELIIKNKKNTLGLEKEIYQAYIELLLHTGLMIQVPLRNYLNSNLNELK